ncbi:M23 family metallopeptidase [Pseudomonas sp. C27(2019)]|uniref:peptidoglycan DD-metalloendopeptidase family protein n=1 Tax=Pseudomonas sp. C27(2019) TaxID=2604941 RepID=UPI0012464586|nr:M23 family metallopeptidase [Pseudomonas sp. C27(2019)]QEY59994.1 M23 family metallopeptidase [Pseudomonas sp. C27(2019)]
MYKKILLMTFLACISSQSYSFTVYKYTDENGVVTYTDQAKKGAQVFVFNDRMVERIENDVKLETHKHAAGETLLLHNNLYAPVEVELALENQANIAGGVKQPVSWVLPPRSKIRFLTLAPKDPALPLQYKPKLRYALGDPRLLPTTSQYALPWRGGPFRLTQGANGKYSHFTPKSRYALDIAMPVGTPIVAARAGVVVKIENQQTGRGTNPAGNFVRVLHDDGTMGVYLHLQKGSVSVSEGQRVVQGSLLARSGNTGNSTGPHLHFVVQRNIGLAVESIPFDFSQPVNSMPNFAVGGE